MMYLHSVCPDLAAASIRCFLVGQEHSAEFRRRVRTRRGPGWHVQSKQKRGL